MKPPGGEGDGEGAGGGDGAGDGGRGDGGDGSPDESVMSRVHVPPTATAKGKLELYGEPPLSVVPSAQLRLQPTSLGLELLEQVLVEEIVEVLVEEIVEVLVEEIVEVLTASQPPSSVASISSSGVRLTSRVRPTARQPARDTARQPCTQGEPASGFMPGSEMVRSRVARQLGSEPNPSEACLHQTSGIILHCNPPKNYKQHLS